MLFNSLHFLVFLPVVVFGYFSLWKQTYRRLLLLAASYYFYAVFSIPLVGLLLLSTVVDYTCARVIFASTEPFVRRAALATSLVVNLGLLFFFKYADFLSLSVLSLAGIQPWPVFDLVLPMGISFYTFQTMAYTIDVYRGHTEPDHDFLDVALYVAFFPQLVAGPIMRAGDLMPQFKVRKSVSHDRMLSGLNLVLWGLAKKMFFADPLGYFVNDIYDHHSAYSGVALLMATYGFALQIYFDFSAYTDIARGAGRILGIELTENFRAPYLAVSIRDFWRRWHISLSFWLRDYLYISLGGSRKGTVRTYVNLYATMLLGGLWHGAAWTFVIWGALHGSYLVIERLTGIDLRRPSEMGWVEMVARQVFTFHLVCLAWVFFRADSFAQATEICVRIITNVPGKVSSFGPLLMVVALVAFQAARLKLPGISDRAIERYPGTVRRFAYIAYAALAIAIAGSKSPEFIYFQF